ncbi:MAG: TIGR04086 family membrane protein [Acidimicrobiales bacterium]
MKVDRRAVLAGAQLAVLVGATAIAVAQAVTSLTDRNANLLLYLVVLGAWVGGGRVAGRRQPESPLTHGALAAVLAYLVLVMILTLIDLVRGNEVADPIYLVFHALLASSMGIFGGYLAVRRSGRPA